MTVLIATLIPGDLETHKLENAEKHKKWMLYITQNYNKLCKNLLYLCYL